MYIQNSEKMIKWHKMSKRGLTMEKFKMIDEKIQLSYEYGMEGKSVEACDAGLSAWEDIKEMLSAENLKEIEALDNKYDWTLSLTNFVQDLEMELSNAGITNEEYLQKRIKYCEELLETLSDEQAFENTRRAIAESYYALGDEEKCDSLFTAWLEEDPYWGWGYIGWSSCYSFGNDKMEPNQVKAEKIIEMALEQEDVRDKDSVLMRAIELYQDLGRIEKVKELTKIRNSMKQVNTMIKAHKIGRNDPCPCGSGKKYKKCCGQN